MAAHATVKQENTTSGLSAWKYRILGAVTATIVVAVPYASAAINFTPIEELLDAVVDLVPTFMDLVGKIEFRFANGVRFGGFAIAPLIVVIAIVGFVQSSRRKFATYDLFSRISLPRSHTPDAQVRLSRIAA
jgi:hypothetical protein